MNFEAIIRCVNWLDIKPYDYLARCLELDRVGKEIQEDLLKPSLVKIEHSLVIWIENELDTQVKVLHGPAHHLNYFWESFLDWSVTICWCKAAILNYSVVKKVVGVEQN